jgi:hypothetical protein
MCLGPCSGHSRQRDVHVLPNSSSNFHLFIQDIFISPYTTFSYPKVSHAALINHDSKLLHGAVLEKFIFSLIAKFPAFYEMESFIMFTRASL